METVTEMKLTPVEACGPPNRPDCYDVVMQEHMVMANGGSLSIFINGFMVDPV